MATDVEAQAPKHANNNESMRESLPSSLQRFLSEVGVVNAHPGQTSQSSLHGGSSDDDGNGHTSNHPKAGSSSIFESSLDLTPERLRFVFSIFDSDKDDRIDYDSLRKGLDLAGNSVDDEESFQKLVKYLDIDQSGDISFEEFSQGMRMLMLRDLYKRTSSTSTSDLDIEMMDYNTVRQEHYIVNGKDTEDGKIKSISAKNFYFQERPDWVQTRWIAVRNSPLAMQHLAVMYSLHPLALEDALLADTHRPKAEEYTSHYFIMCPFFTMEWEQAPVLVDGTRSTKLLCAVPNFICWCLNGFPSSSQQSKQPKPATTERNETMRLSSIRMHMTSMFVQMPSNDTIITHMHAKSRHAPCLGERVKQDLELSYSKLRQYDAQYLVYALLDEAVDALEPIIDRVRTEIENEQAVLRVTHYQSLDRIHHLKDELETVNQKLKPFMRLLTHVIEDDAISPGATIYLRDVLDNLECHDEDIRRLLASCQSVDEDADKFQSRQMDKTLYTLTVISAVFLPAQFLTGTQTVSVVRLCYVFFFLCVVADLFIYTAVLGVWGMNFENMPELDESWGYGMFWGISVFLMIVTLISLNFGRLR